MSVLLHHYPIYVVAAALISLLASWSAFRELHVYRTHQNASRMRLFSVIISAGLGVWATHFVAILGYRPDLALAYEVVETVASMLLSIVFVSGGLIVGVLAEDWRHRLAGSVLSGLFISVMHHVGMLGLSGCIIAFNSIGVFLSTSGAIAGVFAAVGIFRKQGLYANVKAGGAFSLGVVVLHFGSLAGTLVVPGAYGDFTISNAQLSALQAAAVLVLLAPLATVVGELIERMREAHRSGRVALATGEGVLTMDREGRIVWGNTSFETLTGHSLKEIVGKKATEVLITNPYSDEARHLDRAISSGQPIRLQVNTDKACTKWHEINLRPTRSSRGVLNGFVSGHRDVTRERVALTKLERSEEKARKLAIVAEYATDAVLITDARGHFVWGNDSFVKLTGYELEEFYGRKPGEILQGADTSKETTAEIGAALRELRPIRTEILNYHASGGAYWIELEITPVKRPGSELQFIAVSRDVTERIEREKALVEARIRAEEGDRLKTEFLARMSHEIRTPMNGVTGMAALLQNTDLDERQATFVDHIRASTQRLLSVINDVLDFSKLEAEKMTVEAKPFAPVELAAETLSVVALEAERKGLELLMRVDPEIPRQLVGDFGRLRQLLLNLVSNAVKFTETGTVGLDISLNGPVPRDPDAPLRLRFEVRDTGEGIPAEALETVFERFHQLDGSASRQHQGTGLGLSISKGLAEAMGGEISLTSELGKGSTFRVDLALPVAKDACIWASSAAKDKNFLIVCKSSRQSTILVEFLDHLGGNTRLLSGVVTASEIADAAAAFPVDQLILDECFIDLLPPGELSNLSKARPIRLTSINLESGTPSETLSDTARMVRPIRTDHLLALLEEQLATNMTSNHLPKPINRKAGNA